MSSSSSSSSAAASAASASSSSSSIYTSQLKIRLSSNKNAIYIKNCLEVDEELQPLKISKEFAVDGDTLIM